MKCVILELAGAGGDGARADGDEVKVGSEAEAALAELKETLRVGPDGDREGEGHPGPSQSSTLPPTVPAQLPSQRFDEVAKPAKATAATAPGSEGEDALANLRGRMMQTRFKTDMSLSLVLADAGAKAKAAAKAAAKAKAAATKSVAKSKAQAKGASSAKAKPKVAASEVKSPKPKARGRERKGDQ